MDFSSILWFFHGFFVEVEFFHGLFVELVVFSLIFRRNGGFFVDFSLKWWFFR